MKKILVLNKIVNIIIYTALISIQIYLLSVGLFVFDNKIVYWIVSFLFGGFALLFILISFVKFKGKELSTVFVRKMFFNKFPLTIIFSIIFLSIFAFGLSLNLIGYGFASSNIMFILLNYGAEFMLVPLSMAFRFLIEKCF